MTKIRAHMSFAKLIFLAEFSDYEDSDIKKKLAILTCFNFIWDCNAHHNYF